MPEGTRLPGVVETDGIATVINVDPFESETARCTPREFADRFGFRLPGPAGPARPERPARPRSTTVFGVTSSGPGSH